MRDETARDRRLRFLVADDNEDIRDVFCSFIERAGHHTRTARDGQEAVEILERESFDVLLLDLSMPRMGGVEVVRWLRAHPDVAPTMRVVIITAWALENRPLLEELGITTIIEKPIRLQRMNDLIAETLRDVEAEQPVR